jgi:hypothetical protein
MNKIIFIFVVALALFSSNCLYSSDEMPASIKEGVFMSPRFMKITEKVITFLRENSNKSNLDLEGLLNSHVITKEEYDFLKTENIIYNPPSSADPYDNYLSLFDRENEDCTSSHILYDIVDKRDPKITKTGTIDSLSIYIEQWHAFQSDNKSIFIFNDQNFYYFIVGYTNNEHWTRQHSILIDFPENNQKEIDGLKNILKKYKIDYRSYVAQSNLHFSVELPSDLAIIKMVCSDILKNIFMVSPNDTINYTAHGFRFDNNSK